MRFSMANLAGKKLKQGRRAGHLVARFLAPLWAPHLLYKCTRAFWLGRSTKSAQSRKLQQSELVPEWQCTGPCSRFKWERRAVTLGALTALRYLLCLFTRRKLLRR